MQNYFNLSYKFTRYLILPLLFLTSGCASFGGPKGTPYAGLNPFKEGAGQIYIYRPPTSAMALAIPTLKIDGEKALSIRYGSYTVYNLSPGQHTVFVEKNGNWNVPTVEFKVDIKSNQRLFYRLSPYIAGWSYSTIGFVPVVSGYLYRMTEDFATTEMGSLLYSGEWSLAN
ncbi:MAG: DUF2846 domain-containing protein [Gallionella sp.]|nr:DUF2846 domain-containing protein [Gallionella sp.]